jgi:hypothetical protein
VVVVVVGKSHELGIPLSAELAGQFPDGALLTFSISSCVRAERKTLFGCVCNLDIGRGIAVGSHLMYKIHCVSATGIKYSKSI